MGAVEYLIVGGGPAGLRAATSRGLRVKGKHDRLARLLWSGTPSQAADAEWFLAG